MSSTFKVPFGRKDGRLVEPGDLPSGLDRHCVCPGCGDALVVRRGSKQPHFAHYRYAPTDSCVETALHQAAKQALLDERYIVLPGVAAEAIVTYNHKPRRRRKVLVEANTRLAFTECHAEVGMDAVRPDVVAHFAEGHDLPGSAIAIEIRVTHKADSKKREKLRAMELMAIEVDMRGARGHTDLAVIRALVLEEVKNKTWLHFPKLEEIRAQMQAEMDAIVEAHLEREANDKARYAEAERILREKLAAQAGENKAKQHAEEMRRDDFRRLSVEGKERRLRKWLAIDGDWPALLNFPHRANSAIPVPAYLWQAGFFRRYYRLDKAQMQSMEQVMEWLDALFGPVSDQRRAGEAVSAFIAHLSEAGHYCRRLADGSVIFLAATGLRQP